MNLLNLFVLLIFSSSSSGGNSSESLNYGGKTLTEIRKAFKIDYFEDPLSENAENIYEENNEEYESDTFVNSNLPEEHILNDSVLLGKITPKKYILNRPFEVQEFGLEDKYHDEELTPNQSLMRRQTNNWKIPVKFFDPKGAIRHTGTSNPKIDSAHVLSELSDESFPFEAKQINDSFLDKSESSYHLEPPQYYQKNYYYNYYPLIRGHYDQTNLKEPKVGSEEIMKVEANPNEKFREKKTPKKNPCKMYLQFLKYAFKELDKNSEYYDDLDEEYFNWEADGSHHPHPTQLLGPTLYIDNSGRIFQVNTKGNSVQTVEGFLPSSNNALSQKDILKLKHTSRPILNQPKTETPPSQSLYNSFIITYERPPVELNVNTESYNAIEKESMIPQRNMDLAHYTTDPTDIERDTTYMPPQFFSTMTPNSRSDFLGENFEKLGSQKKKITFSKTSNNSYSSNAPPLYLHRHQSSNFTDSSVFSGKAYLRADTAISFENLQKHKENKDPDCNDKMLPCPDTFNVTYPLNGYCNKYVSCESGEAIRRTCSNGYHFNLITKSCDFPHNSICSYYCPEAKGRFGIPGDCNGYFICENYIPEYRMCPPKMHWDVKLGSCTFAAISSCPMKCSALSEIKPYKGDCKAYIICLNGIPYYHKCPPNFIYDQENQTCVPESQFNCINDPRLMTKTSNPSNLCKNVDQKLGRKAWCSYYFQNDNEKS